MSDAKEPHPEETPITSKIIADADACPETRIVFLIKHLANQCKAFERQLVGARTQIRQIQDGCWGCLKGAPQPDNAGDSDRWQDPRDISGGDPTEPRADHDATDIPLKLLATELRDIAFDLGESDADAWRSRISMLRDIAGDLEARSE